MIAHEVNRLLRKNHNGRHARRCLQDRCHSCNGSNSCEKKDECKNVGITPTRELEAIIRAAGIPVLDLAQVKIDQQEYKEVFCNEKSEDMAISSRPFPNKPLRRIIFFYSVFIATLCSFIPFVIFLPDLPVGPTASCIWFGSIIGIISWFVSGITFRKKIREYEQEVEDILLQRSVDQKKLYSYLKENAKWVSDPLWEYEMKYPQSVPDIHRDNTHRIVQLTQGRAQIEVQWFFEDPYILAHLARIDGSFEEVYFGKWD